MINDKERTQRKKKIFPSEEMEEEKTWMEYLKSLKEK